MHQFIDNMSRRSSDNLIRNYNENTPQPNMKRNYDVNQGIVKRNNYWNDWFGRPGAGAPNWDTRKQNLDLMLEPRIFSTSRSSLTSYDPTISLATPRRMRSDHHNRY